MILIEIAIPILYLMIGLVAARCFYRYRVRSGAHDDMWSLGETDTNCVALLTVLGWPLWSVAGLAFLAHRFVTASPPKSPKELKEEREGLERRIAELERELKL